MRNVMRNAKRNATRNATTIFKFSHTRLTGTSRNGEGCLLLLAAAFCFSSLIPTQAHAQTRRTARPAATIVSPAPAPIVTPANVDPAPLTAPATPSLEVRRSLSIDGFIDPNLAIPSRNSIFSAGDLRRGFYLEDASLILSKEFGRGRAVVDLPFSTSSGSTGSNAFSFATTRAQAYVSFDRSPLTVKFGQFDTFLGIEANSSRDRFFSVASAVRRIILPRTHTGAQVGFSTQGDTRFTIRGQIANENGVSGMGQNNPEFGLQGRIDADKFYASLGLLLGQARPSDAAGTASEQLIDVAAGLNLGQFHLGAELDFKKLAFTDDRVFSALVLGAFQLDPALSLGVRAEYLKNAQVAGLAAAELDNALSLAVGPSYKIEDNLSLRGDLDFTTLKVKTTGDTRSWFGITISAVASL